MRCKIFLCTLSFVLTASFAWRHRYDGVAVRELEALEAQTLSENRACDAYRDRWAKELPLSGEETTYGSRALALKALGLLEAFPGWGRAAAAEADRFLDDAPSLANNVHQLDLSRLRGRSHGPCELFPFFREARALISDASRYHFSAPERARLRAVLEKYFLGEPRFRFLIEGMVKINLLRTYMETFGEGNPAAAKVLDEESEERRARIAQANREDRWTLFASRARAFEDRQTQELFEQFYPLARTVFAGSRD